jgi:hypothetical protein
VLDSPLVELPAQEISHKLSPSELRAVAPSLLSLLPRVFRKFCIIKILCFSYVFLTIQQRRHLFFNPYLAAVTDITLLPPCTNTFATSAALTVATLTSFAASAAGIDCP